MSDIAAILLAAGAGQSDVSPLNAFDAALHDGGGAALANINLVQVSSIVPPGVRVYRLRAGGPQVDARGMIAHAVVSAAPAYADDVASAGVGVAVPDGTLECGMIFEAHGAFDAGEAQYRLEAMLEEGMALRQAIPGGWKTHTAVATTIPRVKAAGGWSARFRCAVAVQVFLEQYALERYADSLEPA